MRCWHYRLGGPGPHSRPECLNACSNACGLLGKAINVDMTKGGQAAAHAAVCELQQQFSCVLTSQNSPWCTPLITKAAAFGFKFPGSMCELHPGCRALSEVGSVESKSEEFEGQATWGQISSYCSWSGTKGRSSCGGGGCCEELGYPVGAAENVAAAAAQA